MDFAFFLHIFCSHGFRFRLSQLFFCLLSFLHGFLFLFVYSHGFVVVVFSLHFCWFALPSCFFFVSWHGFLLFLFYLFVSLFVFHMDSVLCCPFAWILLSCVLSHGFSRLVSFRMDSVVCCPFAWILLRGFCLFVPWIHVLRGLV